MNDLQFIWGIKSGHDILVNKDASLYTMNDIDIIYDKKNYYLKIDTIYQFEDGVEGEKLYLKQMLERFTDWMVKQKYNKSASPIVLKEISFDETYFIESDRIDILYAEFKWAVDRYCLNG